MDKMLPYTAINTPSKRQRDAQEDYTTPNKRSATNGYPYAVQSGPHTPSSSEINTPSSRHSMNVMARSSPLATSPLSPAIFDDPKFNDSTRPSFNSGLPDRPSRAGTVEPGLSVLGANVTKLVDLITELRDNGIQRLDVDLPQIVVVGDQSTGKSSLIEGLSTIKVPRKEGCCTRCPIEITLKSTTAAWHCRVSIVKRYSYKATDGWENNPLGLGPYDSELPQAIVEHFADVTDKNEIPIWLERAQLAVLNPGKIVKAFAVPPERELEIKGTEESFSPNIVRLDLQAPGLPSLSFFDLPGVIVQDAEPYVPEMIRKLVKRYMVNPRALVLLTLPIDNDRANSNTAGLVHKAKAQDRTIGIISKPDRLVDDNIQQWRSILAGEKFPLKLGYRVVKNPSDPIVDHRTARREEREFFSTNYAFKTTLGQFSERFGTEKLQEYLSTQLMSLIQTCLPEIMAKVEERATRIEQDLSLIPRPPTGNVVYEIQQKLVDLERHLSTAINNAVNHMHHPGAQVYKNAAKWFHQWHVSARVFHEKLVSTAPQLELPMTSATPRKGEAILIESDEDEEESAAVVNQKNPRTSSSTTPHRAKETFSPKHVQEIEAFIRKNTTIFTLHTVKETISRVNGGVHGVGDPRVFEELLQSSTKHWKQLMQVFLRGSSEHCKRLVKDLLELLFRDLKETELFRVIDRFSMDFLRSLDEQQIKIARCFLTIENGRPLTLDAEGQEEKRRVIFLKLQEQLQAWMANERIQELIAQDVKVTAAVERAETEKAKARASSQYQQEISELAATIAYYEVSAKRFADYTSLSMRNEFFVILRDRLWKDLGVHLHMGPEDDLAQANEYLKELMVPSSRLNERRKALEKELSTLSKAKQKVLDVLGVHSSDDFFGNGDGMEYD